MEIYFFGTKVLCAPPRHHWDCCGLQLAYQERKKYSGWRGVVYLKIYQKWKAQSYELAILRPILFTNHI